jgi:taurine dioxygenase
MNEIILQKKLGSFGIEIYNFNINNIDHTNMLIELLDKYLVIIIKKTYISYEEQIKLARLFGEPTLAHPVVPGNKEFPKILEIDGANTGKNAKWHTDVTFLENPHSVSILIADEVPEVGGDTLWSDLRNAYQHMNNDLKSFLEKLEAVHKITPLAYWGEPFNYLYLTEEIIQLYENSKKQEPVIHPVIRIHPRTSQPSFFVNPGFTSHILNLTTIESDHILRLIYEHMTQPEFILRHKWDKNDIVIWDNISTAHYAINDYGSSPRKMRRITIKGDIPFGYHNLTSRKTNDILKTIR